MLNRNAITLRPERYERVSMQNGQEALHRRNAWWPDPKGWAKVLLRRSC